MPETGPAGEPADYEYRGLAAEAWDVLRANAPSWPDVAFYRDVARASGQPVLDAGCATGQSADSSAMSRAAREVEAASMFSQRLRLGSSAERRRGRVEI